MKNSLGTTHANHSGRRGGRFGDANRRPIIGILMSEIEEYQAGVWSGIRSLAQEQAVETVCYVGGDLNSPTEFADQRNILYTLASEGRLDGLVVMGPVLHFLDRQTEREEFIRRFRPLPMVSIAQELEGVPNVSVDNAAGMRGILTHLIDVHGYSRIACIRGPEGDQAGEERFQVYTEVLAEYDLPFDPELVALGDFSKTSGQKAIRLLFDDRKLRAYADIEAIVAANDNMALAAVETLHAQGIRVPDDVAVTGFDNFKETGVFMSPLTTVRQPTYEMGQQALEMLLAQLAGEDVPAQVVLPTKSVVRQSCGCQSPAVVRATAGTVVRTNGEPFETAFAARREQILDDMLHELEFFEESPELAKRFLDGFITEMHGESSGAFVSALSEVLGQVTKISNSTGSGQAVAVWQNVLSVLRQHALFCLDGESRPQAEDLWQQGRVKIGEMAQQIEAYQVVQVEKEVEVLQEIEAALITTFDVEGLMNVLAREIPRLGIPGCYLSLYDDPKAPGTWSRLVLAYSQNGRITLDQDNRRFQSPQLIPDDIWARKQHMNVVVEPLYFREDQIGFVMFEVGQQDDTVYETLRGQISSALQGAQLVNRVQDDARELAAAYEEIRTLNDQLKQDNIRMSAELDVTRRLQEMLLPPPEELQQIEGLDIVGFMKPADEIGGDYYDVLTKNKILHIGIGDVTGHGLESGVVMLMTQTAIRTLVEHGETDPLAFVNTLNRTIYQNVRRMNADKILTFALIDYQDGQLTIVGQHEELLVIRNEGHVERVDTIDLGLPLGLEKNIAAWVHKATLTLAPGDGIVLYTDGITEAENEAREFYGINRLCEIIGQHGNESAEAIKQAVLADVTQHIGKQKIYDDLTLVVLKQQ